MLHHEANRTMRRRVTEEADDRCEPLEASFEK